MNDDHMNYLTDGFDLSLLKGENAQPDGHVSGTNAEEGATMNDDHMNYLTDGFDLSLLKGENAQPDGHVSGTNAEEGMMKYTVKFRLNNQTPWEDEAGFDTLDEAMRYVWNVQKAATGEFKVVDPNDQIMNNNEEEIEMIYSFTDNLADYAEVVTNYLTPKEKSSWDFFWANVKDLGPATTVGKMSREGLRSIEPHYPNINWEYKVMSSRVIAAGGTFRITTVKNPTETVVETIFEGEHSFVYVKEDKVITIDVFRADGSKVAWDDFGDYMGLKVKNSPKLGKRCSEITRSTLLGKVFGVNLDLTTLKVEVDPSLEMAVDGIGGMSKYFALSLTEQIEDRAIRSREYRKIKSGEVVRGNFRLLCSEGLIKGDMIIVPDEVLMDAYGYIPDMIQPSIDGKLVNLKSELATNGDFAVATFTPHHESTNPHTNVQLLSIFAKEDGTNWLFPAEELKEDFASVIDEVHTSIQNGEFPAYMTAPWADNPEVKMDSDRLFQRLQELSVRWNDSGRDLLESGFFIARAYQGFHQKVHNAFFKERTIRIPIRHAAYLHVCALSSITALGYNPAAEGYDTTKCFFHEATHSWVKPDAVFIENYANHGGEDSDDAEIVMIRNVEFPDGTVKTMAICVRMPCAWGEWAMVEVDTLNFPFYNTWNEMPTVKYADRPEFIQEMEQTLRGMPEDTIEVPDTYTVEWAKYQGMLASMNPGVGQVINPLIGYFATFASYMPNQLAATEDFVDTLQQTPSLVGFMAILGEVERIRMVIGMSGKVIDKLIYKTRLPLLKLKNGTTTGAGYFSNLMDDCCGMINQSKMKANVFMKSGRKIISEALDFQIPVTITRSNGASVQVSKEVTTFLRTYNKNMDHYNRQGDSEPRRMFAGDLNNRVVVGLDKRYASIEDRHVLMLAIYQHLLKHQAADNFLFQTPAEGWERSTMDLFIEALEWLGVASPWGLYTTK